MAKMKAAVVTKAGSDFEIQEREIPQPGAGRCGFVCTRAGFVSAITM
jgi:D-arabinose 1-dehydrogenase-like Zn-dependent alcohol dehydrogenase